MADLEIRSMNREDIAAVAAVHESAFPRQTCSKEWIQCNFSAFPRMQFFVADSNNEILGFIHWSQKSGFRKAVVMELEQIAVAPEVQGRGIAERLITGSLPIVRKKLAERGAILKNLFVTTRADNKAQQLYRKVLGAKVEATIRDLYSADEVLMVARDIEGET